MLHLLKQCDVNTGFCESACFISAVQMIVTVVFNVFTTQLSTDIVSIYDGYNTSSRIIADLSGSVVTPFAYSSTQEYMYIHLTSNSSGTYQGFSAYFQSMRKFVSSA